MKPKTRFGVAARKRSKKNRPKDWYSGFESPPDVYVPRVNGVRGEPPTSKL